MSKLGNFVENVNSILEETDNNAIKQKIGDSTANHRTLTVSQLVRYLNHTKQRATAYNVLVAYEYSKNFLSKMRRFGNRTDAYDVNELLAVLGYLSPQEKQVLSRSLVNV